MVGLHFSKLTAHFQYKEISADQILKSYRYQEYFTITGLYLSSGRGYNYLKYTHKNLIIIFNIKSILPYLTLEVTKGGKSKSNRIQLIYILSIK